MAFAENLQYLRKKNKLTQEELADELELSRQSVSKWETGEAYPETEKLIALAERFGVTMDELVRGDLSAEDSAPVESGSERTESEDSGTVHEARCREHKKIQAVSTAVCSGVMLLCAIVYILIGSLLNLWHPGWLIFFLGSITCVCVGSFTDVSERALNKTFLQKLSDAICGSVIILAVGIYLLIGFLKGVWHPYWVIILGGVFICALVGGIMGREK